MGWITININKRDQSVVTPLPETSTMAPLVAGLGTGFLLAAVSIVPTLINTRYEYELGKAVSSEEIAAAHSTMEWLATAFVGSAAIVAALFTGLAWWIAQRKRL